MDEETFCEELLREQRLALIPGSAFGDSGRGFVRASYATSEETILEALDRLERFLVTRALAQGAKASEIAA